MNILDITSMTVEETLMHLEAQVWAKKGNKVVRKMRCSSGPRKGRTVSSSAQCTAKKDISKSKKMKSVRAAKSGRMSRKSKKTKRNNPISKTVRRLNR